MNNQFIVMIMVNILYVKDCNYIKVPFIIKYFVLNKMIPTIRPNKYTLIFKVNHNMLLYYYF